MSFAAFEQFATQLCAAASVPLPPLQSDSAGLVAFSICTRAVSFDLAHWTLHDNDDVIILVDFGAIEPHDKLAALRLLAEANFELLSSSAPVFSMSTSGKIALRQLMSLRKTDMAAALHTIRNLADLALAWRANPTMVQTADQRQPASLHEHHL